MTREAIARTNARLVAAFAEQDAATATACYTEDAKLMAPFAPSHVGHAAIRDFLEQGFAKGIGHLELETLTLKIFGDTAWEEGLFVVGTEPGAVLDRGKYIVIWKRVGGAWLMARDIMSSDLPARPRG
jgi:ketosteroid isomerase-like protein